MNKRAAKHAADEFSGTIGELRDMISSTSPFGISIINPSLSRAQALDIFSAAIADRDSAEKLLMWRVDPYSARGAMKPTRDHLLVQNIFRECA